ncbi:STAS/SEC14 domain-containing protein [Phototrophicus methaneseepsis]|uniref:STAS/SEC14 domain-containing protein n=1 Tax=Phototrophicus methaneseepsis TaxID=2710758 RepID=A0A7S8IET0_9CHLR|nr:STAS/SEC14 domain-containing protein [Phototrophicus methaneseepsis]QPC82138.1 STAS/SEC14 domain-containing protein [Phototrophicus methaneseepsis]
MTSRHCVYQHYLNNDVHKFIFQQPDEQAVDEFIADFERIMREHQGPGPILLLVDVRPQGIPPFQYTLKQVRSAFARVEIAPAFKAAYLYEKSMLLTILRRFFNLLGQDNDRRFFESTPEPEALQWLLADVKTNLRTQYEQGE